MHDVTKSYDVVLWTLSPMSVIATLLFLVLGGYPDDVATSKKPP